MRGLALSAMGESRERSACWARIAGAIRAIRRTAPPGSRFRSMLILSFYDVTSVNRRYHNFAPFVRQIGERKAQTCAMAILRQLTESDVGLHCQDSFPVCRRHIRNRGGSV